MKKKIAKFSLIPDFCFARGFPSRSPFDTLFENHIIICCQTLFRGSFSKIDLGAGILSLATTATGTALDNKGTITNFNNLAYFDIIADQLKAKSSALGDITLSYVHLKRLGNVEMAHEYGAKKFSLINNRALTVDGTIEVKGTISLTTSGSTSYDINFTGSGVRTVQVLNPINSVSLAVAGDSILVNSSGAIRSTANFSSVGKLSLIASEYIVTSGGVKSNIQVQWDSGCCSGRTQD